ncbi:FHA domain-containing protein [Seongchinamella sediminis]|uniref:FHA domain-containing protein n=1 Tax=Seongchinamella sediminis TaxID=2283635 RepID=A0A3L7E2H2_9GAMM|nr:FHA domain-containing protein [Seongchinamella sediminis]RLQ22960.1 FHA domain-containing protein [Seongchinamella sediminis]
MAQIRDTESNKSYPLRAHHTFGRCTERSDTVVSSPITSRIHLALEWDGQRWNARDLSKNGTWLGSSRLTINESTPLQRGDRLHLGSPEMPPLELIDDSAPVTSLLGLDGAPTLALEPFVFLPDQEQPQAVVTWSYQQRSWLLHPMEHDGAQHADLLLHHGDIVSFGGQRWQVFLTETEQSTEINQPPDNSLEDIEFVFDLSQDEENTALKMNLAGAEVPLGERSHHYLLLHLARLRAMEAARGYDGKTQGWVDNEQIKKDLGMDMPHINIMIFRARKQIAEKLADTWDSEHLVERGKGRMRFGGSRFKIYKGEQLAFALSPDAS